MSENYKLNKPTRVIEFANYIAPTKDYEEMYNQSYHFINNFYHIFYNVVK